MRRRGKTSPLILAVVAILVLVVAVEIVQVYQKLGVARAEEAALNEQLQAQQEKNDALRDDLSHSEDLDFWKQLARDNDLYEDGARIFYDVNE